MKRIILFGIFALFLLSTFVHATQIIYQSPKQMGQKSTLVARGKVASVQSKWNQDRSKIFTETTIAVDESYKGRAGGTAKIVQLGGVVGNVRMHVHGALAWREGEEVLVFLEPSGPGTYLVSGFSQGKFTIHRDPVTGDPFVTRPALDGADVVGAPGKTTDNQIPKVTKVSLDSFIKDALESK